MIKFRNLKANEIDLRVGTISRKDKKDPKSEIKGFTLLLYKDARVDANILDETVGQENWQCKFYQVKNTMICSVGIYFPDRNEWIYKDDAGDESQEEAVKGEASDSFKRACFKWNIGRLLYESPFIYISCENGYNPYTNHFYVKEIEYSETTITKLVIVCRETKQVAYSYGESAKVSKNAVSSENTSNKMSSKSREVSIGIIQAHEKFYQPNRFKEWLGRITGGETDYEKLSDEKLSIVASILEKNSKKGE